jgi:hypothetical protein
VKNDDKITGETLSQTVPGNTLGEALQDIEISPKTRETLKFLQKQEAIVILHE